MRLVHALPSDLLKINFNVIFPQSPRASKRSLSLGIFRQNPFFTLPIYLHQRATFPAHLINYSTAAICKIPVNLLTLVWFLCIWVNLLSYVNCVVFFRKLHRILPLLCCPYLLWKYLVVYCWFSLFPCNQLLIRNLFLVSLRDSVILVSFFLGFIWYNCHPDIGALFDYLTELFPQL
jgi:hypothetical protein